MAGSGFGAERFAGARGRRGAAQRGTTDTEHARAATPADPSSAHTDWLAGWRAADEQAAEAINGALRRGGAQRAGSRRRAGGSIAGEATLFVASSMPVRDIETFWPAREDPPRVLCNRGANGIDGTVSSAFGAAAFAGGPVVLLIGDVALAHDIGGLLAAKRLGLKLTIVLLDNDGGGIFDFLPVSRAEMARENDMYTEHIATPTSLDFAKAAELYGLEYEPVETTTALRAALEQALCAGRLDDRARAHRSRGQRGAARSCLERRVAGCATA